MKRVLIICLCLLLCACGSKENVKVEKTSNNKKNIKDVKETYQDNNNTVVGLYKERGNKLELVTDYSTDISSSKDIDVYQIYFSNESTINLDSKFGEDYYNKLNSLDNSNIKVGFNIKYSLDNGEVINQTVLRPSDTIQNEYIFLYIYDDYKNRDSNFYSHIEDIEYSRIEERHAGVEHHKAGSGRHKPGGPGSGRERVLDMAAGLVGSQIPFSLDGKVKNLAGKMLPEAADVCARKKNEFENDINQSHIRSHTPFVTASLTSSLPSIICETVSLVK